MLPRQHNRFLHTTWISGIRILFTRCRETTVGTCFARVAKGSTCFARVAKGSTCFERVAKGSTCTQKQLVWV